MGPFPAITLTLISSDFPHLPFTSKKAIQKQKININSKLPNGIFSVMLSPPNPKNEVFLILIEYRTPQKKFIYNIPQCGTFSNSTISTKHFQQRRLNF